MAATFFVLTTCVACGKLADKIKTHVEIVGSELTGTAVKIEEFNLRPAKGMGEIKGLTIANPEGYQSPLAMEMGLLNLNLGIISTIVGDPLVLDELIISNPIVNYEQNTSGGSNLEELSENTKKNEQNADTVSAEQEPASSDKPDEPVRLIVRHLIIEGVTLNVLRSDGASRHITLPRIELTDVGGQEGVKPGRFGLIVIGTMTREMVQSVITRQLLSRQGDIKAALSTENLVKLIGGQFELSSQQLVQIRPVAVELSKMLANTVDLWVEQGFIDYKSLASQLAPAREMLQTRLKEILSGDQAEKVRELFTVLQDNSIEIIHSLAVAVISDKIGLSTAQLRKVRPILQDHMAHLSELIDSFTREGADKSLADFAPAYLQLINQLNSRLSGNISRKQMERLTIMHDRLLVKIDSILAGEIPHS